MTQENNDPTRIKAPTTTYRVKAGDTLYRIAGRYSLRAEALAAMNGIAVGSILSVGQQLTVPAVSAGGSGDSPIESTEGVGTFRNRPVNVEPEGALSRSGGVPRVRAALPSRGQRWMSNLVALLTRQLGVRYRWGGTTPAGFDCSGLLYYAFGRLGVALPRTSFAMFDGGAPVPRDQLETGDLVFFQTLRPGASHAGIYLGDGRFIHSSPGTAGVAITPMGDPYYAARYLGARRY